MIDRLSERDESVVDSESIVPDLEAPDDEGRGSGKTSSLPYFTKHLTCDECSGRLIAIGGVLMCESCGHMEGCCD